MIPDAKINEKDLLSQIDEYFEPARTSDMPATAATPAELCRVDRHLVETER